MLVKTFPVGAFQCNCTILGDGETGEAIVIDPGDEADRIMQELKSKSFTVKYMLHTHAHLDHIGGTRKIKDALGGTIGLHKDDLFLYENIRMQGDLLGIRVDPVVRPADHYLVHGDEVEWGKTAKVKVLHTPGHTPGSLSFHVPDLLPNRDFIFTGDTLFLGSIGRTDLWGGDYDQLIDSIKTRLMPCRDDAVVVAGHGPNSTIGQERRMNPFLVS